MRVKGLAIVLASATLAVLPVKTRAETLFFDDFESGNTNSWVSYGGNWQIVDLGGNSVMRQESFVGGGNHFTFATPSFSGSNYAINLDMMILERASGDVGAGFKIYRATSNDLHQGIALNLFPRSSYLSVASANQSLPRTEYTFPMNIETGKWYNVGLEVNNGFFNVFLDGSKVLSNMPTDLVRGYISLDTDDMKADFDNIGITAIPEPSPLALVAGGLVALTRMRKRKR